MMTRIWTNLISGWNFMKVIRVLAGLLVIGSGVTDNNSIFVIIGSGFLLFALLAPGTCCMAYMPPRNNRSAPDLENIEYEELDVKQ